MFGFFGFFGVTSTKTALPEREREREGEGGGGKREQREGERIRHQARLAAANCYNPDPRDSIPVGVVLGTTRFSRRTPRAMLGLCHLLSFLTARLVPVIVDVSSYSHVRHGTFCQGLGVLLCGWATVSFSRRSPDRRSRNGSLVGSCSSLVLSLTCGSAAELLRKYPAMFGFPFAPTARDGV
jgi:hypothetical protein